MRQLPGNGLLSVALPSSVRYADSFSLRAKSRLRRLRSDTRLRAQPRGGSPDCRKRCAHPLAPSARGLRPQAVGERTVRLPEIFRAMARFSPSAPSGHLPRRGRFFDTLSFPRGGSLSLQKNRPARFSCGAVLFYFSLLSKIRSLSSAWPTFSAKRSSRPSTVVWARSSPLMSSTI